MGNGNEKTEGSLVVLQSLWTLKKGTTTLNFLLRWQIFVLGILHINSFDKLGGYSVF